MRISALADQVGLPIATVKYYLRQGLLPAGRRTSRTQAQYDGTHIERLRLIRALLEVGGLSVATAREIVRAVDSTESVGQTLAEVQELLPPRVDSAVDTGPARAALDELGWSYDPDSVAVRQLAAAMQAAAQVGLPVEGERLRAYAGAAHEIATGDLEGTPGGAGPDVFAYAIIGTLFYEPVLLALRRLAHQDCTERMLGGPPAGVSLPGAAPTAPGPAQLYQRGR